MMNDEFALSDKNIRLLALDFYTRPDVVQVARDLLGKVLVTEFDGERTAGIITETEAYRAPDDRACHAFGDRRTARTEVMFQEGGCAYIYLCYGIHHLFNVVTGPEGAAHAVLIRAVQPIEGQEIMVERRAFLGRTTGLKKRHSVLSPALTTGPGALSQALGLDTAYSRQKLHVPETPVWIGSLDHQVVLPEIEAGKRIGVDYAGACAEWPWRFWVKGSAYYKKPV